MTMDTDLALLRLLQLVSPSLPVGMYSYSQGMEQAVENGWIKNEAQTRDWLAGLLRHSLARLDAALLVQLYDAWARNDADAVVRWSMELTAMRETEELRTEDRQTGQALAAFDLHGPRAGRLANREYVSRLDCRRFAPTLANDPAR